VTAGLDNAIPQTYTKYITYIPVPGSWERRAHPDLPLDRFAISETQPGEIVYVTKGTNIACGGTARLERLPSGDVVKTPLPDSDPRCHAEHRRDMRLEARIYDTIGPHPRVPRIISWDPQTCCLTMEYLENGTLKEFIGNTTERVTPQLRYRWAKQASEGLSAVHAAGVIHCDISPRNFLLDHDLHLKIADFWGGRLSLALHLPLLPAQDSGTPFLTGMRLHASRKMYLDSAH
jgi:serine/threonine protein kinase